MDFYQVFKCVPTDCAQGIYSFEKIGDYETLVEANEVVYTLVTQGTDREQLIVHTCSVPQFVIDKISRSRSEMQLESWRRTK